MSRASPTTTTKRCVDARARDARPLSAAMHAISHDVRGAGRVTRPWLPGRWEPTRVARCRHSCATGSEAMVNARVRCFTAALGSAVVLLVACTSNASTLITSEGGLATTQAVPTVTTTTPQAGTGPTSSETCDSQTPIGRGNNTIPEVQGIATDATVYGLLFLKHSPPIRDGEEVKIVWRMTGKGDLSVTSQAPSKRAGVLTFGPEAHAGSTYQRPGDEWGTGFLFDEPGCWHIHLKRSVDGVGDIWFEVEAAGP